MRRLLAAALLLASCPAPKRLLNEPCTFNDECAGTQVCVQGSCRAQCRADRDCLAGYVCARSDQPLWSVCLPAGSPRLCAFPSDCPETSTCVRSQCREPCQSDDHCVRTVGGRCGRTAPGICDLPLRLSLPAPMDDSGADASAADAALDAPSVDAPSMDAPSMDAPSMDAPSMDAPSMDAPSPDMPPPDVSPPDVSPPDVPATTCDGGPCDRIEKLFVADGLVLGRRLDGHWVGWQGPLRGTSFPWATAQRSATMIPELEGAELVDAAPGDATLGAGFGDVMSGLRLHALGVNGEGRLGIGDVTGPTRAFSPLLRGVAMDPINDGRSLSIGAVNGCVIAGSDRRVTCWGDRASRVPNESATDGFSTFAGMNSVEVETAPGSRAAMTDVLQVAVGERFACALLEGTHRVACWGSNASTAGGSVGDGALGAGEAGSVARSFARVVPIGEDVRALQVSGRTACAMTASGRLLCWGSDRDYLVGDGVAGDRSTPVDLGLQVLAFAMGSDFACARPMTGALRCWGRGAGFRLAGTSEMDQMQPTPAVDAAGAPLVVESVSAGRGVACGRGADGAVRCWGALPTGATRPVVMPM